MSLGEIFAGIKDLFFEFLGYFIPGVLTVLFFLAFTTNPSEHFTKIDDKVSIGLGLLCYLLGYVCNPVTYWLECFYQKTAAYNILTRIINSVTARIKVFDKSKRFYINEDALVPLDEKYIFSNIITRKDYRRSLEILRSKGIDLDSTRVDSVREARSIVMSFIPDSDSKILTFTFRAEIFRSISMTIFTYVNICLLTKLSGLLLSLLNLKPIVELSIPRGVDGLIMLILLGGIALIINGARIQFLRRSLSVPFSIFVSKYSNLH